MTDPSSFRILLEKVKAEAEVCKINLPVTKESLQRVLSKKSLDIHYDQLYGNYVKNAIAGDGEYQFAGAKLHTLFFEQFQEPNTRNNPVGDISLLITEKFGSYAVFKESFTEIATNIQGAGWAYLSKSGKIKTISNHKLVSDIALIIDMWEHSFIIDYGIDKKKYINSMWSIINWNLINERLSNVRNY